MYRETHRCGVYCIYVTKIFRIFLRTPNRFVIRAMTMVMLLIGGGGFVIVGAFYGKNIHAIIPIHYVCVRGKTCFFLFLIFHFFFLLLSTSLHLLLSFYIYLISFSYRIFFLCSLLPFVYAFVCFFH